MHSLADTGNQALLMFGSQRGQATADAAHPFGYGPERYFWAFVVALVLFSLGGLFALYEGIDKLIHPHEVESADRRLRHPRRRRRPRDVLAAHRGARGATRPSAGDRAGGGSSAPPSRRSCPSCCSRTPAR